MTPLWQAAVIAAVVAAIASIIVAIIGRRTSRETNAVTLSKELMTELDKLKKTATDASTKADQQERRVGRLERVLDAALDHIADWEEYHAGGDEGDPPEQPRVVREFRDRLKNHPEEEA